MCDHLNPLFHRQGECKRLKRVERLGVCSEKKDFLRGFRNTGKGLFEKDWYLFKNKIDTAPCVYSMLLHSLEHVCLFENFLEEIKFLVEKIYQIFSHGGQGGGGVQVREGS